MEFGRERRLGIPKGEGYGKKKSEEGRRERDVGEQGNYETGMGGIVPGRSLQEISTVYLAILSPHYKVAVQLPGLPRLPSCHLRTRNVLPNFTHSQASDLSLFLESRALSWP